MRTVGVEGKSGGKSSRSRPSFLPFSAPLLVRIVGLQVQGRQWSDRDAGRGQSAGRSVIEVTKMISTAGEDDDDRARAGGYEERERQVESGVGKSAVSQEYVGRSNGRSFVRWMSPVVENWDKLFHPECSVQLLEGGSLSS